MKGISLIFVVGLATLGKSASVMDFLFDEWMVHTREMMNSTFNSQYTVKGMKFDTECFAFITKENCTAEAELGVVRDLSSLVRASPVSIKLINSNERVIVVNVQLAYDVLEVHYPNMMIRGPGVMMEYKNIDTMAIETVAVTVELTLDYTKGVQDCESRFQLVVPPLSAFKATTTIQKPPAKLTLDSDLTKNIMLSLINTVKDHISALINYKKPCSKLAHLF